MHTARHLRSQPTIIFCWIIKNKRELTAARTRQLCEAMTVTKDLMANLLLAAVGKGGICTGGGGSTGELTNWDGTKKKTGWGIG